jgi:hypothetical protein
MILLDIFAIPVTILFLCYWHHYSRKWVESGMDIFIAIIAGCIAPFILIYYLSITVRIVTWMLTLC